jgi:hypothetical protein
MTIPGTSEAAKADDISQWLIEQLLQHGKQTLSDAQINQFNELGERLIADLMVHESTDHANGVCNVGRVAVYNRLARELDKLAHEHASAN